MSKVNLFGLNAFGNPTGMERVWGAAVGAGVGTVGAIAARKLASPGGWASRWSEAVGLLTGAGASLLMVSMPGTRAAGWMGLVATALNNGLRVLEQVMFGGGAVGWPVATQMGMVQADQINGLGYTMASQQPHAYGTVPGVAGVAGPIADGSGPPVNLMGLGGGVNLLGQGGGGIGSLAGRYGATIMG